MRMTGLRLEVGPRLLHPYFHHPKSKFLHLEGPIFDCSHANYASHAIYFSHGNNGACINRHHCSVDWMCSLFCTWLHRFYVLLILRISLI